ncbi:MAG TPA: exodeoxyribonuclease VII small subunit [Pseudogracilibacillus sp.]|nr:exodeoxyribonuclease VII small subunit [Pseudogracilibacillus sp.]
MTEEELSFEDAIQQLEKIVAQLEENEEIPLEKAINLYQEGMKLSQLCDEKLKNAQDKVTKIINDNQEEEPFDLQGE